MPETLPESIFTVWRLVDDGPVHVAFVGDRALWRWPWANLAPLAKAYGAIGLGVGLLVLLLVGTARSPVVDPDGTIRQVWRTSQLVAGLALGGLWLGLPLAWGVAPAPRWEARPGVLEIAGERVNVGAGVRLELVSERHTTRHGQLTQRVLITRRHLQVLLARPGEDPRLLATFHQSSAAAVTAAVRRLGEVSGAEVVERRND